MLDKELDYVQGDHNSEVFSFLGEEKGLTKTASYDQEITEYLRKLERKQDKLYALINALSASEYYGCFFKGEQIHTIDGYKSIENIKKGDEVLTEDNTFQKVLKTFQKKYKRNKCKIRCRNIPTIQESTDTHPFLVLKKEKAKNIKNKFRGEINNKRDEYYKDLSKLKGDYLPAKDINPGDYLYIPIKPKHKAKKQYSLDKAYLFGYYLSEGCLGRRYGRDYDDYEKIIFTFNKQGDKVMTETLTSAIKNLDRIPYIQQSNSTDKCIHITLHHKKIAQELDRLFGHQSTTKYIHPDIFNQSEEWIKTFLAAYLDGDGHVSISNTEKYKGVIKMSTASKNLSHSLIRLFASVGIVCGGAKGCNRHKDGCFGDKDHTIYELQIPKFYSPKILKYTKRLSKKLDVEQLSKTSPGFYILPTGYILVPVKSVELEDIDKEVDIFNFEVENNNTYTTTYIGHNSNRNGDAFPEKALKKRHHTFVDHGHVYKHHKNKNPKNSMGKILFSHFNDGMKRVELVVELDKEHKDVKDIIRKLSNGEVIKTSMGAKVPYDVCNICHKKAKKRKDYCEHLKYKMGKVLKDGRKVSAINTKPRFFDISIVTIPADPTSSFMSYFGMDKVASLETTKSAKDKKAEIKKKIETSIQEIEEDPKNLIRDSQPRFTKKQIEKLSEYPLNETLSTFIGLRVLPLKEDFQKLALYSMGKKDLADELEKRGEVFDVNMGTKPEIPEDINPDNCNIKVAEEIYKDIPKFSLTKRDIINRIIEKTAELKDKPVKVYPQESTERSFLNKAIFNEEPEPEKSPVKSPMIPMMTMGALYAGYNKLFGSSSSADGFTRFMKKNPWLAPIVMGGVAYGSTKMQENEFKNNSPLYESSQQDLKERGALYKKAGVDRFVKNMMVTTPLSYYGSMKGEEKAQRGQPINNFENFVRKHPFPTAFGSALIGGSIMKNLGKAGKAAKKSKKKGSPFINKKAEYINGLNPEIINQIYNELIYS